MRMTLSEPGVESRKASMRPLTRFAWLALAYNIAVILWGAYVRPPIGSRLRKPLAIVQWHCSTEGAPGTNDHRVYASFDQWSGDFNVSSLLVWCWRKTSKATGHAAHHCCNRASFSNEALLGPYWCCSSTSLKTVACECFFLYAF